nr:MarR family transcriptional regulator [Desulfuromonadales bacterium]
KEAGGVLTTGEIARTLVRASQTMTGLVDRLEDQELVDRQYDRSDRRKVWVRLTAKGQRKLEDAMPVVDRLTEDIFSVLTDEDLRDLGAQADKLRAAAIERLAEALERQAS